MPESRAAVIATNLWNFHHFATSEDINVVGMGAVGKGQGVGCTLQPKGPPCYLCKARTCESR